MKSSELTREELIALLVHCAVTGIFRWKVSRGGVKAGDIAGSIDSEGYLVIGVNGKIYRAHLLAWLYVHGIWPSAEIDHINRKRDDNRIANLREASRIENMQNKGKYGNNTSGHVGVSWRKDLQKWRAYIEHKRKKVNLGYYTEQADAVAARRAGEIKYWGAVRNA